MEREYYHLISSVFFGRDLPHNPDGVNLRGAFVEACCQALPEVPALVGVELRRTFESWRNIENGSSPMRDRLLNLKHRQTFAIYVREQNSGLIITRREDLVIVSVFPVAAGAGAVMGAVGELCGVFPSLSVEIPWARVTSTSFVEILKDLCENQFAECLPESKKAGTTQPETRDAPNPKYVTEWLLAALAGTHSAPSDIPPEVVDPSNLPVQSGHWEVPAVVRVRKKIRDSVRWDNTLLPWRRSGEWMAVKVVLHCLLVRQLGPVCGTLVYKTLLLRLMYRLLRDQYSNLGVDLVVQMTRKVGRRLYKLRELAARLDPSGASSSPPPPPTPTPAFTLTGADGRGHWTSALVMLPWVRGVMKEVCTLVLEVREHLDSKFLKVMSMERERARPRSGLMVEMCRDVVHQLASSMPHFVTVANRHEQVAVRPAEEKPVCAPHLTSFLIDSDLSALDSPDEMDKAEALYRFEHWICEDLWGGGWIPLVIRADEVAPRLLAGLNAYIASGSKYYKQDPLGSSRLILTSYTLVAVLHWLAVNSHMLLAEHRSGVDTGVLQQLVLPDAKSMQLLQSVEQYFEARNKCLYPGFLEKSEPSRHSVAARFADRQADMQQVLGEIQQEASRCMEAKRLEVLRRRGEYERLMAEVGQMECEYLGQRRRSRCACDRCRKSRRAEGMRVSLYEYPLPTLKHLQLAVVFDLRAPLVLLCLRDSLDVLARDVCGWKRRGAEITRRWTQSAPLRRWRRHGGLEPQVGFGSSSKSFLQTHYSTGLHPTKPEDEFLVPNGYKLELACGSEPGARGGSGKVRLMSRCEVDAEYASLQWTLDGVEHTQNEVLARQAECDPKLELREFVVFGSLRAGHRLQLRNLVRALEMRSLSFARPSVVSLLSQALWEAGPPGETPATEVMGGGWWRDAHVDLRDEDFSRHLLRVAAALLSSVEESWASRWALYVVVMIAARVLTLSERSWAGEAAGLLRRCRGVADQWAASIEAGSEQLAADQSLRWILVEVSGIGALTFCVDEDETHTRMLLGGGEDGVAWLRAAARVYDNLVLMGSGASSTDPVVRRSLLRRVHVTALGVEPVLRNLISTDSSFSVLTEFVRAVWPDACRGEWEGSWEQYLEPADRWFRCYHGRALQLLQVDVRRGGLLIDGSPQSRLPAAVTGHQDFLRVFADTVFVVMPAATGCPGTFITKYPHGGSKFRFCLLADERLVVTEVRADGREFELFPSRFLEGDLPVLLVDSYSHWLCKGVLYFRAVRFSDPHFSHPCVPLKGGGDVELDDPFHQRDCADCLPPYALDFNSGLVSCVRTDRRLVDVRSGSFHLLYSGGLRRLEYRKYIHVFVDTLGGGEEDEVTMALPRMNLHFCVVAAPVTGEWVIRSREYEGFRVASDQSMGTLVGLQHGLLLCRDGYGDGGGGSKKLIVPHGNLVSDRNRDGLEHQDVYIKVEALHTPPFFVYDIDIRLRQLRAAAVLSGWLYLVLLHARTSHPLPDHFTGLTGMESALRLLQSARCWPSQPLDACTQSLLVEIGKLSPKRVYYPPHLTCMETVHFPPHLPPSCAHDAFVLIAARLWRESGQLAFLFPPPPPTATLDPDNDSTEGVVESPKWSVLNVKAYWRSREAYGTEGKALPEFEESLEFGGGAPGETCVFGPRVTLGQHQSGDVRSARQVAFWEDTRRPPYGAPGRKTLLDGTVKGVTAEGFEPGPFSTWRGIDFKDSWLDMYNWVRRVPPHQTSIFPFLFSFLVYCGVATSKDVCALQLIHKHAASFPFDPPSYDRYKTSEGQKFVDGEVEDVVRRHAHSLKPIPRGRHEDSNLYNSRVKSAQQNHERGVEREVRRLVGLAKRWWPGEVVELPPSSWVNTTSVTNDLEDKFRWWYRNLMLRNFQSRVESVLGRFAEWQPSPSPIFAGGETAVVVVEPSLRPVLQLHLGVPEVRVSRAAQKLWNLSGHRAPVTDPPNLSHPPPVPDLFSGHGEGGRGGVDSATWRVMRSFEDDFKASWVAHHSPKPAVDVCVADKGGLVAQLRERLSRYGSEAQRMLDKVELALRPQRGDEVGLALEAAGLWRRVVPAVFLPPLLRSGGGGQDGGEAGSWVGGETFAPTLVQVIGALAVAWTQKQHMERCLDLAQTSPPQDVLLKRELRNCGYDGWTPASRPEWLLLQLEWNFLIWRRQVVVAEEMMTPRAGGGGNAVMQLNMGEGKTSVIVPLLAASLADGECVVRITVLRSLFRTNLNQLAAKLGGLLNRRVYQFPCRRDFKLGAGEAETMQGVWEECRKRRGVVLTRPEHMLSFELKVVESCRTGGPSDALGLLKLQRWVHRHARTVLDESDEILRCKYQLVYTVGAQQLVGGGAVRWGVAQSVLLSVGRNVEGLKRMWDEKGVECFELEGSPDQVATFPKLRLTNGDVYPELCKAVVEDALGGCLPLLVLPPLTSPDRAFLKRFLLSETATEVQLVRVFQMVPEGAMRDSVLVLRGILSYSVLRLVLEKRWKVNYGVDPCGARRMAVPFRAKDVAMERTEFGHPDVGILLSQLSYYYKGLSLEELVEAFGCLVKLREADEVYAQWVEGVPSMMGGGSGGGAESAPMTLSGVNLADPSQMKTVLYPLLRQNTRVIDFWLGRVVYPVEAKQFGGKLVATPWDLCSEGGKLVTGFSGTNDSKLLLPLTIRQTDLPELLGTNASVVVSLLAEENRGYTPLPPCVTGRSLLQLVAGERTQPNGGGKLRTRVLLDVGALVVDLSNEQMAREWLDCTSAADVEAVVYFDVEDQLVAMARTGRRITPFHLSPFCNSLHRCAVYLDDIHTRGTDLKLPAGTHGCVTLGKGVTKDRLVQACMRLRQLGDGHTVSFLASQEVHAQITSGMVRGAATPSSEDVLRWAVRNSVSEMVGGFLHWAGQGLGHCSRQAVKAKARGGGDESEVLRTLGDEMTEKEVVEVEHQYGQVRLKRSVTEEMARRLEAERGRLRSRSCSAATLAPLNRLGDAIVRHCSRYVGEVVRFTTLLDEEQERELEHELEEELQLQRPGVAEAYRPLGVHRDLELLARTGELSPYSDAFTPLTAALRHTSLYSRLQISAWSRKILTTQEFGRVVVAQHAFDQQDEFVRPPTWVVVVAAAPSPCSPAGRYAGPTLVLISPFEANRLLPLFRQQMGPQGQVGRAILCMYAPRLRLDQRVLVCDEPLLLPRRGGGWVHPRRCEGLGRLLAQLGVFAGNLFFKSREEEEAFCQFLGLLPMPRLPRHELAFEAGMVLPDGFVPKQYRAALCGMLGRVCQFDSSPVSLAGALVNMRANGCTGSDVECILMRGARRPRIAKLED